MHGRKRALPGQEPTPEQRALQAQKLLKFKQLGALALKHRLAHDATPAAFELNAQLLCLNPDVATLWNYRRECLLQRAGRGRGGDGDVRGPPAVPSVPRCGAGCDGQSLGTNGGAAGTTRGVSAAGAAAPTGDGATASDGATAETAAGTSTDGVCTAEAPAPGAQQQLGGADAGTGAAATADTAAGTDGVCTTEAPAPGAQQQLGGVDAGTVAAALTAAALTALVAGELRVTADAIGKNPKSYPAWYHRKWVVRAYPDAVDLDAELALCDKLLDADERNFNCWNYRRWVAARAATPVTVELAATLARIRRNFSNYSAWHYRTALLAGAAGGATTVAEVEAAATAAVVVAAGVLSLETLREELALVRAAVFTEPDDQSPWFYRRWLVGQLQAHMAPPSSSSSTTTAAAAAALLAEDVDALRVLQGIEGGGGGGAKWPRVALAHALGVLASCGDGGAAAGEAAVALLRGLAVDDGMHAAFYEHELRRGCGGGGGGGVA